MDFSFRLFVGMIAGTVVGAVAYRARSLTNGGAVGAAIIGTAAVAAGWVWAAVLILYFLSSSALSRIGRDKKRELTSGMIEKQGPRDMRQVLANGFVFLVAAAAATLDPDRAGIWMAVGIGSLAASAADTWATEIGTLVGQTPRSILGGRALRIGESGGVTPAGLLASLAGAVFVAAIAVIGGAPVLLAAGLVAGGIAGSLADSFIGATIQQRRWCDACEKPTEMFIHKCGAATRQVGGVALIENDAVNLIANAIGGGVAALVLVSIS